MLFWEHLKCSPASNTARWPRVKPRFMSSPWYLLHLWQNKRAPICISSADKVRAVHTQLFPCYSWPLCWTITLFSRCIGFAHSPFWSSLSWLVAVSLSYTTPESIPPFFSGRYDLKIYIFWPHSYYSWLSVRKQKLKWKQPMLSSVADLSLSLFPDFIRHNQNLFCFSYSCVLYKHPPHPQHSCMTNQHTLHPLHNPNPIPSK